MSLADTMLQQRMIDTNESKLQAFFSELRKCDFSDYELNAVPSLFLPCWGEGYSSSVLRIAIAGKETSSWSTALGKSLLDNLNASKNNSYNPLASCEHFRENGPAKWRNTFWHYAAAAIGKIYGQEEDDVLNKNNPVLQSIAWFNGHALETLDSTCVDKQNITLERMRILQSLVDKHGLSSFVTFINIFQPHVILYFYRNKSGIQLRTFKEEVELRQSWGNDLDEYQLGNTLILNLRHTSWMARGNMTKQACADLIAQVLKAHGLSYRLPNVDNGHFYELDKMSANEWRQWVSIVRTEADKYPDVNDLDLSRHLILTVARELRKTNSTMTAQLLVLLLNEVVKFQNDNWKYSPEGRGPCSCVRGAYNDYANNRNQEDADIISQAFTKLNGCMAYE